MSHTFIRPWITRSVAHLHRKHQNDDVAIIQFGQHAVTNGKLQGRPMSVTEIIGNASKLVVFMVYEWMKGRDRDLYG